MRIFILNMNFKARKSNTINSPNTNAIPQLNQALQTKPQNPNLFDFGRLGKIGVRAKRVVAAKESL